MINFATCYKSTIFKTSGIAFEAFKGFFPLYIQWVNFADEYPQMEITIGMTNSSRRLNT